MREQRRTQVVGDRLPGCHLKLRVEHPDDFGHDLQQQPGNHDEHQQRDAAVADEAFHQGRQLAWKWLRAQDVVDDGLQRPRRERTQTDFDQAQQTDGGNTCPIWTQKRQRPRNQCHVAFLRSARRPVATLNVPRCGSRTAVSPSAPASFTISQPTGWYARRVGRTNLLSVASVEMVPSVRIARTAPDR